jgi:hypothetical protein
MSELDLVTQAGGAAGAATLVGAFMRWLHGREAAKAETTLALLVQKVDQIADSQKKHDGFGERLALVEQTAKRGHERVDEFKRVLERLEEAVATLARKKR